jgi:hypothetical protein
LHAQLYHDITFLNAKIATYVNKKRTAGPVLKKGDKVYLWRRNITTKRKSQKLDFLKIGLFEIKDVKGLVNYKLCLPKGMRIHPVFYISLLEPANPETLLDNTIQAQGYSRPSQVTKDLEPNYEVEKILDYTTIGRQHKYKV